MIELRESEFDRATPVFEPLQYHLAISALIDGCIPGRIWVDDPKNIETAVIWDTRYSYYLSGNEDNHEFNMALDDLLTRIIAPEALKRNIKMYFIICPPYWEKKILNNEVLVNWFPKRIPRCYYTFKKRVTTWKDKIPPGFSLNRVDKNLLESTLVNIDILTDEVKDIIASVDEFIQRGFEGFCLVYKNEIAASWCLSFMYKSSCEFTVQTVKEYQKRGFGTITTAALIDSCLSSGFTSLGWHCGEENVASMRLAEKVGFERTNHEYSWIYGNLKG